MQRIHKCAADKNRQSKQNWKFSQFVWISINGFSQTLFCLLFSNILWCIFPRNSFGEFETHRCTIERKFGAVDVLLPPAYDCRRAYGDLLRIAGDSERFWYEKLKDKGTNDKINVIFTFNSLFHALYLARFNPFQWFFCYFLPSNFATCIKQWQALKYFFLNRIKQC